MKEGAAMGDGEGRDGALNEAAGEGLAGLLQGIFTGGMTLPETGAETEGVGGDEVHDEGLVLAGDCRACDGARSGEAPSGKFCSMFRQQPLLAGIQVEHGVLALAHAQFLQITPALQRQHTVMSHSP